MSDEHYLRKELSEQTSRTPAIFDFLQSAYLGGVWYWNLEQPGQAWMSPRFWQVLGYDPSAKQHLATEWQGVMHPDDWRTLHASLEQLCTTPDHTVDQDLRYTHQDGSLVWVRCQCVVIRDQDNKPIRLLGVQHDITALKRAEEEGRRLATQLAAANRELEAFSYSISHDLRAPLRAVDGFSRMLVEDCADRLDEDGKRMLSLVRSESQRMSALVGAILTFSRLGRQKMDSEAIDMRELAQEVFDELCVLNPTRQLRLDLQPLPPTRGTRAMIRQVWVHLIGNAVKFTKDRAVGEIEIGTRAGEDEAPIYYVKDNGVGFDMLHVGRLFGMFQHLHNTEEYPGVGAGLMFVQRIVQRHEGRVWAEGEVERGATFYFTIPPTKL